MRLIRTGAAIAAALTLAGAAAACSSGSSTSGKAGLSSGSSATGKAVHGGTVTIAWEAAQPNFIFPLPPATNTDGYNANLTGLLWPFISYSGDGAQSAVNPKESLFSSITYSNNNQTATMVLKSWKWSDGAPITSRDFTFVYNLLKYNYQNWNEYIPGQFPTDVTSVTTPDTHTVVMNLKEPTAPAFFTDDVLNLVPLMPQHAWDKTSVSQPVGNYDQTAAGAKAVYSFLQKEGSQISTFATNPLWKVVDGPFMLSQFSSDGTTYTYVPNPHYSGTVPALSKVVNQSFTTSDAEMDALRAGSSLQLAQLPLDDLSQLPELKAEGYSYASVPTPGVASAMPNFYNAQVGPMFRQLYIRQAMEDLINRPQIVSKVYSGYADPGNGPVPLLSFGNWASPLEKSGGPYPYAPSTALSLLKSHGWKVVPNGVSTCQSPGTGATQCGAGISAGEKLQFQLTYSSGETTTDQENAAIAASEEQAGIKLNLHPEPFNTMVGTIGVCTAASHAQNCGWQLAEFGYSPFELYPADTGNFASGGNGNQGGYDDPQANSLIAATLKSSDTTSFFAYEDYVAKQLPWLWLPLRDGIVVYKSNLAGITPLNPFSGGINPEDWYYTK
jgi:peptide/nickel transport system substrate-binding protein